MRRRTVQSLSNPRDSTRGFGTGVSLHSHTCHSREGLGFLPRWASDVPVLGWQLARQMRRYEVRQGRPPDFGGAHWTPPLSSVAAFDVERRAIEEDLALNGIVSITDHDNIDAGVELCAIKPRMPISVEWTVPLGTTFLHLGVHNLPRRTASEILGALASYTKEPNRTVLGDVLATLDAEPSVLIILNHPLWDQAGIGTDRHRSVVRTFLKEAGDRIHALELNGLRPCDENQQVIALAAERDWTLVSGGDRHGCEPNAVINLTDATTFGEFADEVRSGASHVLFLPHYEQPLKLRIVRAVRDILAHRPELLARARWTDRVFYTRADGASAPLSAVWGDGEPAAVRWFVKSVEFAGGDVVWRLLRLFHTDNGFPTHSTTAEE